MLESLEHALKRGARIYAEVIGYGMSGDAHHMTDPDPDGAAALHAHGYRGCRHRTGGHRLHQCARHVDAGRRPGRRRRDQDSRSAIMRTTLAVSSTKSMTGHLLGAAGGH